MDVIRAADRREGMQMQAVHDLPRHDVDPAVGHLQVTASQIEFQRLRERGDVPIEPAL